MSRELTDAEYAAMLAGGNASIFWHSLPKDWTFDVMNRGIQDAIYCAVRQVFKDRLNIELPNERPAPFGGDVPGGGTGLDGGTMR